MNHTGFADDTLDYTCRIRNIMQKACCAAYRYYPVIPGIPVNPVFMLYFPL